MRTKFRSVTGSGILPVSRQYHKMICAHCSFDGLRFGFSAPRCVVIVRSKSRNRRSSLPVKVVSFEVQQNTLRHVHKRETWKHGRIGLVVAQSFRLVGSCWTFKFIFHSLFIPRIKINTSQVALLRLRLERFIRVLSAVVIGLGSIKNNICGGWALLPLIRQSSPG